MAKRKRKIFYWVQDTGLTTRIWWVRGSGWVNEPNKGERSNVKVCYSKRNALRHCRKINLMGGRGHIGMWFYRKGIRRYREMWFANFIPWT